jgi:large subunit ribosomal protein L19
MSNLIEKFNKNQAAKINEARGGLDKFIADFKVGDTVKVKYKITEGTTTRIQVFMGVVIAKSKSFSNYNATFTVRKISANVGVERKFALYSPLLAGVEMVKQGLVRRAKLYYLRELTGKASRIKEKLDFLVVDKSTEEAAS